MAKKNTTDGYSDKEGQHIYDKWWFWLIIIVAMIVAVMPKL